MVINLTNIYKKYKGLWVALDDNLKKVISSGKSIENVHREATKKGYKKPVLFKVPKRNLPYIGINSFQ